ncbi:MAG: hypothetical protein LBU97_05545, partial [Alistipes sp.]|nr:hypothetical protein [Alistipes sp.]
ETFWFQKCEASISSVSRVILAFFRLGVGFLVTFLPTKKVMAGQKEEEKHLLTILSAMAE